jgi:hypothetical protein
MVACRLATSASVVLKWREGLYDGHRVIEGGKEMIRSGYVILAALVAGTTAGTVLADGVVTITNPGASWRDQSFAGGAFQANFVSGSVGLSGGPGPGNPATSFLTFCVEHNEDVGFSSTHLYNAYIRTSAYLGGVGGGGAPFGDPLDSKTAALYSEFRHANIFGGAAAVALGGDGVNTAAETKALQRTIWFIEQEIGDPSNGITTADFQGDALALALYNWSLAHDTGTIGDVRVLRLWNRNADGSDGSRAQDQLTIVPLPPAAWAGMGSLASVMAIGFVRRRRHNS